jgi:hypothetical protein
MVQEAKEAMVYLLLHIMGLVEAKALLKEAASVEAMIRKYVE